MCVFDIALNCQPVSQSQSLQLLSADPVNTFLVSPLKHVKKNLSKIKWLIVKNSAGEILIYAQMIILKQNEWDWSNITPTVQQMF